MLSPEGAAAENLCGIPAGQGEKRFDAVVCKRGKAKNRRYENKASRRILKETGEI